MMVVGAFNQVQSSLRWFVDNLSADRRLARDAAAGRGLPRCARGGRHDRRRTRVASRSSNSASDKLELDDLQLALPEACATLDQSRVEIGPGERVQILGEAGSGKSTLFRALAGMWPWGGGNASAAAARGDDVHAATALSAARHAARRRVLSRASPGASTRRPWAPRSSGWTSATSCPRSTAPSAGTSSCRSTSSSAWPLPACCCTRRVGWSLDDAISALGDAHRRLVLSLHDQELVGATLIRLGRDSVLDGFWNQTLHIVERPDGPCLRSDLPPRSRAAAASPTGQSGARLQEDSTGRSRRGQDQGRIAPATPGQGGPGRSGAAPRRAVDIDGGCAADAVQEQRLRYFWDSPIPASRAPANAATSDQSTASRS